MSFSKISVLVPTRKRINYLKDMLSSYKETVKNSDQSELIFRCDNDDIESIYFLSSKNCRIIIGQRLEGYKSLPVFFNEMSKIAGGDLLICGNDDMLFKTNNWPQLIIDEANKYPDGIFNIGVSTGLNDDKFPFSIVSKKLVDAMGLINDPRLLFSDIFLLDVAKYFNRAVKFNGVSFFHNWAGHRDDITRQEANQHEFNEVFADNKGNWSEIYRKRHEEVVKETIDRIIQNSNAISEIILNNFQQFRPSKSVFGLKENNYSPDVWPQYWGSGPNKNVVHYNRDEIKKILDEIFSRNISRERIVLSSINNGLPTILWSYIFNKVLTVSSQPFEQEFVEYDNNITIAHNSISDSKFIYRIIKRIENLSALILDEIYYGNLISPYYLFRKVIEKPGVIIFNHTANRLKEHEFVFRFINELENGMIDGLTHKINHIWIQGGSGMSFEIIE